MDKMKVVQDINAFLEKFKGLQQLADALKDIGSIEQSARSAEALKAKAYAELEEARAERGKALVEVQEVSGRVKDALEQVRAIRDEGEEVNRKFQAKIMKDAKEAEAKQDGCKAEAKAEVEQAKAELQAYKLEIQKAKEDLKVVKDKVEEVKAKLASFMKG